jgi:predicted phage terminase large subunit-like protein
VGRRPDLAALRIPDALSVKAERSRRSFHHFFVNFAWPVLLPSVEFRDNWHIHAICEHLEALKRGQIRKLCINMPFRQLKSTLVSQAFMAWDWIDDPHLQYMTASYAKDLSTRDAVASRRIVESDLYRSCYGDRFYMTSDQNVKTRYENSKGGGRVSVSTESGATGFGGNRRIVDDPVNPRQADSLALVHAGVEFWKGTFGTRANDPERDTIVLVQQRLNENDTTGHVLKNETGWEHLVLPMRYESKYTKTTSLGFRDPRKREGELMMPSRVGEAAVVELETNLGPYHVNAQMQQRPEPRGGVIFDRADWRYWKALPSRLDEVAISVDCTFKNLQTSDYVAIQTWGSKGADDYLIRRVKERMSFAATVQAVKSAVSLAAAEGHDVVAVLIEDKANGSAVIETLSGQVSGVIPINPDGGKASRAYAMQPQQIAGNVHLPDPEVDPKVEVMVGACSSFTGAEGGDDDEVDAMTQYVNWRRVRFKNMGLVDFMRQQHEAAEAKRLADNNRFGARAA